MTLKSHLQCPIFCFNLFLPLWWLICTMSCFLLTGARRSTKARQSNNLSCFRVSAGMGEKAKTRNIKTPHKRCIAKTRHILRVVDLQSVCRVFVFSLGGEEGRKHENTAQVECDVFLYFRPLAFSFRHLKKL